jgi:hypothetical protein
LVYCSAEPQMLLYNEYSAFYCCELVNKCLFNITEFVVSGLNW